MLIATLASLLITAGVAFVVFAFIQWAIKDGQEHD